MKFTSDPAQRRQITKLMDAYLDAGAAIVQGQQHLAEIESRQAALRQRAADEASARHAPDLSVSAASIAALAADPAAAIDEAEPVSYTHLTLPTILRV